MKVEPCGIENSNTLQTRNSNGTRCQLSTCPESQRSDLSVKSEIPSAKPTEKQDFRGSLSRWSRYSALSLPSWRSCRYYLTARSVMIVYTFVLVVGSVSIIWFPFSALARTELRTARETQLLGEVGNVAENIRPYFQSATKLLSAFEQMYNTSFNIAPDSSPKYFLDNFGVGAWTILAQNPSLQSLLIAQARNPSLVDETYSSCNIDATLIHSSYLADLHPIMNGSTLVGSCCSVLNAVQGSANAKNPLSIRKQLFRRPCNKWIGNSEALWGMQCLPGSWTEGDSGLVLGALTWLRGVVVVGKYPNQALYKKVFVSLPGPYWSPQSAFGAISIRVGSSSMISTLGDPTSNLLQILEQAQNFYSSDSQGTSFLLDESGHLLATSTKGQDVELRSSANASLPGWIEGLVHGDDALHVQQPVQKVAKFLMERYCANTEAPCDRAAQRKTLYCDWERAQGVYHVEGHSVATRHITDPLSNGLSLILVSLVAEIDVMKQADGLNTDMAIVASIIVLIALLIVVPVANNIMSPLRRVTEKILLLGNMQLEEAIQREPKAKCCRFKLWEVQNLQRGCRVAGDKLIEWREKELARGKALEAEREARINKTVSGVRERSVTLVHPMSLTRAADILKMDSLITFENLRDAGKHVNLDTFDDLKTFRESHVVVFLSHQWLGWNDPDPYGVQLASMKNALERIAADIAGSGKSMEDVYVWIDYCSVSQKHRGLQMMAISALTQYAAFADIFVVIAPPANHKDSCRPCNLETYTSRGWCRTEMLSKVCSSGLDNFYILTSVDGELEPMREMNKISMLTFEGQFSCCQQGHKDNMCDKELLVMPVLGLYSLLLQQTSFSGGLLPNNTQTVIDHIERSKSRFLPSTFTFHSWEGWEEERELFGPYTEALENNVENHVKEFSRSPSQKPVLPVFEAMSPSAFSRRTSTLDNAKAWPNFLDEVSDYSEDVGEEHETVLEAPWHKPYFSNAMSHVASRGTQSSESFLNVTCGYCRRESLGN